MPNTVLHVISGLGMGGAERNLVQIASGLKRLNIPQHVACVGDAGYWADDLRAQGIGVTPLGVISMLNVPAGLLRLFFLLRTLKPQVLQGWMYHGDLFAALAHQIAPGRQARRLFWNLRASNTDDGGYGRIVAVNARLSTWPDLIVANSTSGLEHHLARGYRPRRTKVIPNGIDTERFRPDLTARSEVRAQFGIPQDAVVAIHVARVDPMKDHPAFLQSMAELSGLRGILVGAGTETLSLPDNVQALGLRHDVERFYAAADIVVSTSAFAEGFSNTVAEGMSAGLIPIVTDIGDAQLIVGDVEKVVASRNPELIVRALRRVSELPLAERQSKAQQARKRIVEQFSLSRAIDRYARLYDAA